MTTNLIALASTLALPPSQFLGIPIALAGAVFLSLGAQLQHRGVIKVDGASVGDASKGGLNPNQLRMLFRRPSWVSGTLMLGAAILLQLTSLAFSPLIVVQPVGAFGLVVTTIINAQVTRTRPNRATLIAVGLCVGGVGAFVLTAAFKARELPIGQNELIEILAILGWVLLAFAIGFVLLRKRLRAVIYVVGAGVLYGFVATLAKVVIARITARDFTFLTAVCVVALLAAVGLGAYFVQNAYASGPPDLVIAGLTVIDPLVAVTIGVFILQEATEAGLFTYIAWGITATAAIVGVVMLARNHPQVKY